MLQRGNGIEEDGGRLKGGDIICWCKEEIASGAFCVENVGRFSFSLHCFDKNKCVFILLYT